MRLLVCSEADNASINIRERLLEMGKWREEGTFDGNPSYSHQEMMLVSIDRLHINEEDMDSRIQKELDAIPEVVIFLSRHKAASGIPTLTVHPIGNFDEALFGGKARTLVPASPHLMTSMLRRLTREAADLEYQVSFEVTHHGPYLSVPSIFVEIGSDVSMWDDHRAAAAIARTLFGVEEEKYPILVGMGGGHYAPRFTELSMSRKVSFGHMVPNYALKGVDSARTREMVKGAAERSLDASMVYVHRKSMKRSEATSLIGLLSEIGLEVVHGTELDPLDSPASE